MENAIKYTPAGGSVRVSLWQAPGEVGFDVADSGPGIPATERQRVFERFYRPDPARARGTGGFGLGLAIAREAVVLHGGSIGVEDRAGGGSLFRVRLPRKPASRRPVSRP